MQYVLLCSVLVYHLVYFKILTSLPLSTACPHETEFADESCLLGEEGYVLATVQTTVEFLILHSMPSGPDLALLGAEEDDEAKDQGGVE